MLNFPKSPHYSVVVWRFGTLPVHCVICQTPPVKFQVCPNISENDFTIKVYQRSRRIHVGQWLKTPQVRFKLFVLFSRKVVDLAN